MSEGTCNTELIVRALEAEANAVAAELAKLSKVENKDYRLSRMESLIEDLMERIVESEGHTFEWLGITMFAGDGGFDLCQGERRLEVRAGNELSIVVDNLVMEPNPELPILDNEFYDAIMERILDWARSRPSERGRANG